MKLIKTSNYDEMTAKSLDILVQQIKKKPDSVISFTSGASPEGLVIGLAKAINEGLDVSECTIFNLDEFIGDPKGVFSVKVFMHDFLYDKIANKPKNIFMLNGDAKDQEAEIARYEALLGKYPRDIQYLGLGVNGHLGANEPGTPFDAKIAVRDMAESTIVKTMHQYSLTREGTPTQMFTMGFKEIMDAKKIVLQVSGTHKAQAVKDMFSGEVTTDCPASILTTHPDFVCVCDEEALSMMDKNKLAELL